MAIWRRPQSHAVILSTRFQSCCFWYYLHLTASDYVTPAYRCPPWTGYLTQCHTKCLQFGFNALSWVIGSEDAEFEGGKAHTGFEYFRLTLF